MMIRLLVSLLGLLWCHIGLAQSALKLSLSHERGYYQTAFNLILSSNDPTATIRYTLDGSKPSDSNGQTYT
ncbi:MAG: chitobiase/beta-hexosaminidase C-terminal domain-containing protein, partial [Bacteroidota bacterium]